MTVELEELYVAYRKAKKDAFGDTNCAHGLKFAVYEAQLSKNLRDLQKTLNAKAPRWPRSLNFIGRVTCIPKSVEPPKHDLDIHCQASDPLEQWNRHWTKENRAEADFRPVIDATVDFMIVSALWILRVGHLYDEKLDTRHAVGNRLRRWRPEPDAKPGVPGRLNELSPDLFQPYFTAYGKWRSAGLKAMRTELENDHRVVAITMDLKRFYHRVNPRFLLHPDYLEHIGVELAPNELRFTENLINAIETWNRAASKNFCYEPRGLPVGLSASSLIANVLLKEFDDSVVASLAPSYYSRYVDDVFLVVRHPKPFKDGMSVLEWLDKRLEGLVTFVNDKDDGPALKVNLGYADGSELLFVGKKQKIFQLEGQHGLDLITPIEEQIREQTSEHRDLPELPDTEKQMAHRALLVTPDATLNADALRKADAVTIRRSGFAMLLGDVEAHVRDLEPATWRKLRHEFYGLAHRHLLSPSAFFDYARYLPRILSIMAACGDWEHARRFIRGFKPLLKCLRDTCKCKETDFNKCLKECVAMIGARMTEAVLQAPDSSASERSKLVDLLLERLHAGSFGPPMSEDVASLSRELLFLDWARKSYATHWLEAHGDVTSPVRPRSPAVREALHLESHRVFQNAAELPDPYWPALAFPTRPIPLLEITSRAPRLLADPEQFALVVRGLRGTWMPEEHGIGVVAPPSGGPWELSVPYQPNHKPKVAITSFEVTEGEWAAAADGTPVLTLERYRRLNSLLDSVVACKHRPDYVLLPECSLPRRWAMGMAARILPRGISIIAGLEYRKNSLDSTLLHNEALIALRSTFPGYMTGLCLLQPKREPAWHEARLLAESFGKSLAPPGSNQLHHPVYAHHGFRFGVLICSELTALANRLRFQGQIDALFIPEWNQDIESFSALVESAALDVHAYVIQANNRRYGDTRMRAPMKIHHRRDLIRLKGGMNDYFVVGEVEYMPLRRFQSNVVPPTGESVTFKPFPIGFPDRMSPARRTTPGS